MTAGRALAVWGSRVRVPFSCRRKRHDPHAAPVVWAGERLTTPMTGSPAALVAYFSAAWSCDSAVPSSPCVNVGHRS
jgi:hypothetical protein